jgi:putative ABC transport system permease protein
VNSFRALLLGDPSIAGVSASSDIPGRQIGGRNNIRKASEDKTHNFITAITMVDEQFLPTFQMGLAAGRNLSRQDTSNILNAKQGVRVLVNEQVVKGMGFKNDDEAIHQRVTFGFGPGEQQGEIVGVVRNYHQRSLREAYDPVIYLYPSFSPWSYFSVHVDALHLQQNLGSIASSYKNVFGGYPFEYFFLNEYFDRQYQSDQRFGKVFSTFTILAIFIACLGLLGLSSFVIRMRTKEIGIRKVLGASSYSLVTLFSKDFVRLVILASVVAVPVIWFAASRWLQDYAFHIRLGWLVFILPPLLLLALSLVTIGIQSLRAGAVNPVKNLRTE